MTWGCSQNAAEETEVKRSDEVLKTEPIQSLEKEDISPVEVEAAVEVGAPGGVDASAAPDAYGRQPGDEHYGHSHAPQASQGSGPQITPPGTAAPASGPDAYGRQPGDEHYGHSHD